MKDKKKWLIDTLLPQFNTSLSANLIYLHNTLTWTVTLVTAGIIAIMHFSEFPNHLSLASLNILLLLLVHFSIRTGKAYLNVVRYGMLDKQVVRYQLETIDDDNFEAFDELKQKVIKYHCDWVSPLSRSTVIKKVLFELGFAYFIGINIAASVYAANLLGWDSTSIIIILITIIFLILEIFIAFIGSTYFKSIDQDSYAKKIK
ncbi:hypothetical protein L4D20_04345 [Vibrio kyushuensis]|uniref:hypothetical protein n=1 Tax=Vibrio kyushuensis TaxID=2910249 RepID=UPI003D0B5298